MLCQICKKNAAKIHVTQVRDGKKISIHICPDCAHEKGVAGPAMNTAFSIDQILGGVENGIGGSVTEAASPVTCATCGLTYNAFKESGRLGCAICYEAFETELQPLLLKLQKELQHRGKIPAQGNARMSLKREIVDLKHKLKAAVDQEIFEEAARLRDRIRDLERELIHLEEKARQS